ncbi:hypothetical protein sscle_16g109530 [Sclerotinia sclerotiorum 1980 UF-70]|uniref:Uncharacterized protein n=1 Tax=Sclerotinia sclerotiorum (strain ATCC 18683 / 1980 / Ss-1) TaxID=665079 RepID=A0A1D9QNH0_SCLS1|nr:hypothetical protein sscle_16g109530 [Sclerotinia sclerotiorum 1980 UF-70]
MVVDSVPKHLETLVRDRDGPYCTMTMSQASGTRPAPQHVESAHVIPPSMLRDIETAEGGHLISVLEAFISTSHVHRLRKLLSDSVEDNAIFLRNIWLLSPIVHKAFRADHIEVRRIDQLNSSDAEASQTEMYRVKGKYPEHPRNLYFGNGLPFSGSQSEAFSISTTNPKDVPLPSDFLFDIHRRFSSALHLFSIEDKINDGWPKPTISILQKLFRFPISIFKRAFHSLWLWIPASVRLRYYRYLWTIGERLCGPEEVQWVQRVPFGLYIKET